MLDIALLLVRAVIDINIKIKGLVKALITIANMVILKKIIIMFTRPSYILIIK